MAKLMIIYQSFTGKTEMLAKEVMTGAGSSCEVIFKNVKDTEVRELKDVDGVIMCSTQPFDTISSGLKGFLEKAWGIKKEIGGKKVSAVIVTMSGDQGALQNLKLISKHFKFEFVGDGLLIKAAEVEESKQLARDLGKYVADQLA